jgi:hypothetical protein
MSWRFLSLRNICVSGSLTTASPKTTAHSEVWKIGYEDYFGIATGISGAEDEGQQRSEQQTIGNRIRNLMRLGVNRRNALLNGTETGGRYFTK